MRIGSVALGLSLAFGVASGVACSKSGPSAEEQARADTERDRKLQAEIDAFQAPYREAARHFLHATSSGDDAGAYALLAPSYQNMVPPDVFAARIRKNRNFSRELDVKVLRTSSQAGTTRVRCILGDLGLAEVAFADTRSGPRISAITIGGMPALPGGD
jgi:hypothetical protein